jgi:hypothetical protein
VAAETDRDTARLYTTKQMGDACEMIVAGELTLAGIPAMKAPDYWPGCDVVVQPPGGAPMQGVSVKARTYKPGSNFVGYNDRDVFDWLAIVLLPGDTLAERRFFLVPRSVCDERFSQYPGERTAHLREIRIDRVEAMVGEFRNNFRLLVAPSLTAADGPDG